MTKCHCPEFRITPCDSSKFWQTFIMMKQVSPRIQYISWGHLTVRSSLPWDPPTLRSRFPKGHSFPGVLPSTLSGYRADHHSLGTIGLWGVSAFKVHTPQGVRLLKAYTPYEQVFLGSSVPEGSSNPRPRLPGVVPSASAALDPSHSRLTVLPPWTKTLIDVFPYDLRRRIVPCTNTIHLTVANFILEAKDDADHADNLQQACYGAFA